MEAEKIKVLSYTKNNNVVFELDGETRELAIQGYELTQPAKGHLSKHYEDWQVNWIAQTLKDEMVCGKILEGAEEYNKQREERIAHETKANKPASLEKEIREACN